MRILVVVPFVVYFAIGRPTLSQDARPQPDRGAGKATRQGRIAPTNADVSFGTLLKQQMDQLGIECRVESGIQRGDKDDAKQTMDFVKKHFAKE
jgi:hypothetical protein